jgi:hypothetical protein
VETAVRLKSRVRPGRGISLASLEREKGVSLTGGATKKKVSFAGRFTPEILSRNACCLLLVVVRASKHRTARPVYSA